MSNTDLGLLAAMATCIAALCGSGRAEPAPARPSIGTVCSLDSLGRAAAMDTVKMQRRTAPLPLGESTEGGEASVYYDAGRPRVVVIAYFGEMGKEVLRYSLLSANSYVVERQQVRYRRPITIEPVPHVISRLPSVVYVCDSRSIAPLSAADSKEIGQALGSTLARFPRHY